MWKTALALVLAAGPAVAEHIQTDQSAAFTLPQPGEYQFTMSLQAGQPYSLTIDRNIRAERPTARPTDSVGKLRLRRASAPVPPR